MLGTVPESRWYLSKYTVSATVNEVRGPPETGGIVGHMTNMAFGFGMDSLLTLIPLSAVAIWRLPRPI